MKIWIVNPFDNLPMEGNRPQRYWLMAEAFVRAGHEVVYWTSDFSHARKRERVFDFNAKDATKSGQIEMPSPRPSAATFAISPRFQLRLLPTMPYKKNICLARVLSHLKLAKEFERVVRKELGVGNRPEVVIASMPPLGLCDAARKIAWEANALFVADVQDAWPETFARLLPKIFLKPLERKAREIYQEADGISAVAKKYLDLAAGKYKSVAPMWLSGHAIKGSKSLELRVESLEKGKELKLVYAGNVGKSYDIATLVKAVERIEGVTLDIAGTESIKSLGLRVEGLGKIREHGYLGERELKELLESAEVGIIPMFPDSEVGVPGKLADYAMSGLKVIESLGGECEKIVEKHNAGVHYEAGNVESLKSAIEEMKLRCEEAWDKEGFAAEFAAEPIMDRYVKKVEGLVLCRKEWGTTKGHRDIK